MPQMDAVVLEEWGDDLAVQTVDRPEPEAGEVRVDVRACAVTRTIENAVQGGLSDDPAHTPRIPGHEFAGVVDAIGPARYGDIEATFEEVSSSTLSTRLNELVEAGILSREQYDEIPPRVEYELTEIGEELGERLEPLLKWAEEIDETELGAGQV